ncbi:type II toxin-antitoxin system RelE/ParE family toxin [Candidatus Enterococcus huntleyi]|uniref:type II toxin-antitoxin system RelE/ParE family toxin n=1 Tax=Candidatus Enterococcus huntleyi TaxID=1857217 RepID=UPI003B20FF0C
MLSRKIAYDIAEIGRYMTKIGVYEINITHTINKIYKRIEQLQFLPHTGAPLDLKIGGKTGYRCAIVNNYVIFYKIIGNNIRVTRILSERQDYFYHLGL